MNTHDQGLILDYLHGRPVLDTARLNDLLRNDSEARRFLLHSSASEVRLRELALVAAAKQSPGSAKSRSRWHSYQQPLVLAACLAFIALTTWLFLPPSTSTSPLIARLISTNNARWDNTTTELRLNSGDDPVGQIRLQAGRAEFLTARGATVILDAPAEVHFVDATSLLVTSGRVVCRCPTPESRLAVRTAETVVIDLGTEFSVEARTDRSTRVAVLTGEVQVESTILKQGQAAEVRTKGVTMLSAEMMAEMQRSFKTDFPIRSQKSNQIKNGQFDASLGKSAWDIPWQLVQMENGALSIRSKEKNYWPNARQAIWKANLPGKVVALRAKAMQLSSDPLVNSQFGILKLTFIGDRGVEFAYASRHFQFAGDPADQFQEVQVAAIAPPGTKGVHVQLMLNARGESRGRIVFDDVSLTIDP